MNWNIINKNVICNLVVMLYLYSQYRTWYKCVTKELLVYEFQIYSEYNLQSVIKIDIVIRD